MKNVVVSGFADEICLEFEQQLKAVKSMGMGYISLRTADGKSIADYTATQAEQQLKPLLDKYSIKVSSLGSPIGKIKIDDEEAFNKQLTQLRELCEICRILNCRYIRIFSFFMPHGEAPANYAQQVIEKLREFVKIAEKANVILIHENEKEIYGDIASRCANIFSAINSPSLKAAFDFANFVQCKENPKAAFDLLRKDIAYIHIKDAVYDDNENVLCGTGDGQIELLLARAAQTGYEGFLTLEPHLFLFDSLKSLETVDAKEIIKENKAKSGEDAYRMQYDALMKIINKIN